MHKRHDRRHDTTPTAVGAQTSEEYLAAVTVGDRKPHNSTIELAAWTPRWATLYTDVADKIRHTLTEAPVLLEHVGSTAVPGLSAKPFLDMLLVVANSADEAAYLPALEAVGFRLRIREPAWHEHRFLIREAEGTTWQLHVFSAGCPEVSRMLMLRDRLRTHDGDRLIYEAAKQHLAARTWRHIQHYADAKSEIIHAILERAATAAR